MDVTIWRISADAPDYKADDLSGRGAEQSGGRWNRKGTPLVYASGSRALACLETVVHLSTGDALPLNRYLVAITIPAALWRARAIFDPGTHVGWNAQPAGKVSLDWGTTWATGQATLLAQVPSAIVPEEHNIIINPRHRDRAAISAARIRKWTYDPRLS